MKAVQNADLYFFLSSLLRPIIAEELDRKFEELSTTPPSKNPKPTNSEGRQDHYVYGLAGLAKLLGCSLPTAQSIKNSGKVPYTQIGRKLVFDADEVFKSLEKSPKRHRYAS